MAPIRKWPLGVSVGMPFGDRPLLCIPVDTFVSRTNSSLSKARRVWSSNASSIRFSSGDTPVDIGISSLIGIGHLKTSKNLFRLLTDLIKGRQLLSTTRESISKTVIRYLIRNPFILFKKESYIGKPLIGYLLRRKAAVLSFKGLRTTRGNLITNENL